MPKQTPQGRKRRCNMAEKKGMTEIEALTLAVEMFKHHEYGANEIFMTEIEGIPAVKKLEHMIEVRSRKHERKADDSKRLANIALGEEFAANFKGETFKAADVAAALHVTTAKASAICRTMGWEKVPSSEKVLVYKL